jgi:hypothetical protein
MSKKINKKAYEQSADKCKNMKAKVHSESPQQDVCASAFQGVRDEGESRHATPPAQASASSEANSQHSDSNERADMADRQRRDSKASVSSSVYDVKDRIARARRRGPSHPLRSLAKAEADLHDRSAALTKLSSQQRRPGKYLLVHQLPRAISTMNVPKTMVPDLRGDAIALQFALGSEDIIESILNQHIVAMSSRVMDCHARAAETSNLKAADVYLRHVEMGTKSLIHLVEARERRRSPKQISVGQVNVESGGQAIVGNVEAPKRRRLEKENRLHPSLESDEDTGD